MAVVKMPDGKLVRFPDDMPNDEIKSIISQKYPSAYAATPALSPLTAEQKAQNAEKAAQMVAPYKQNVGLGALTGTLEGIVSGLGRVAGGATLGATDWIDRKTGGNIKAFEDNLQARAENAGVGGLNNVAKFVSEMGGLGKGAANLIMKGAKTLPQMIGKGAIEGGIFGATGSDSLEELPSNVAGGATFGGAGAAGLGMLQKGIQRLFPALNAQGKAKSLTEVFSDRESTAALKKGAKASQQISDRIAEEMPVIKDNINSKMDTAVNKIVGEAPDIEGMLNDAKTAYSDYMVMNGNNPVDLNPLRESYKKLTRWEKGAMKSAVANANIETNAPLGTVDHTHQMRMIIDDAIDKETKKSDMRHVPSLMKIRNSLDEILKTDSGYKAIDDKYAQAMRVSNAYNAGTAATKKSKPYKFTNDTERQAWISGVNDTLQNNLATPDTNYAKVVSDNLSIMKKGLGKDDFGALKKASNTIKKEYTRAAGLDKIVNKESAAENLPFWREILESVGSAIGTTVGTAEKAAYGLSDIGTANRILNGTADSRVAQSINNLLRQSVPSTAALMAKRMAEYKENQ